MERNCFLWKLSQKIGMPVNSGSVLLTADKILLTTAQYSDETAATLAEQLLDGATDETCIAVVSAPSSFIQLKNLVVSIFLEPLRSSYKSFKSSRFLIICPLDIWKMWMSTPNNPT